MNPDEVCNHPKLRFNAATVFMKKNEENGEIGVVAICDDCGKTYVGDVEAGLSNAWRKRMKKKLILEVDIVSGEVSYEGHEDFNYYEAFGLLETVKALIAREFAKEEDE